MKWKLSCNFSAHYLSSGTSILGVPLIFTYFAWFDHVIKNRYANYEYTTFFLFYLPYKLKLQIMTAFKHLKKPPLRTILLLLIATCGVITAYLIWKPGKVFTDGRHDLHTNAIWIGHGWLGDDIWFKDNQKDIMKYRGREQIRRLAKLLSKHGIKYVYPHLCPATSDGQISGINHNQSKMFLSEFTDFKVLPWIGGALNIHCYPKSEKWRKNFISSIVKLLKRHPEFAGIHLNIEPLPNDNRDFLTLLDEIRKVLPENKILSVAAYPPPTIWHRFPEVHWDKNYFRQVAKRCDQIVPMMYDTAIRHPKFYQHLISAWTKEVIEWSEGTEILLGLPLYDDQGVGYHFPDVENIQNALKGIHNGLNTYKKLPVNYSGIALYCEWEIDNQEWEYLKKHFGKNNKTD